ncbi:MAG: hypothetical protein SF053_14080 [Bacteroidia bacterium]|nr:hypothetical protein [Bacteroidia bacterium]
MTHTPMPKAIPVVTLLLCLVCPSWAQEIVFAPDVSDRELLETLFEGVWNRQDAECVWAPNLAERLQFGGTEDGFLYTQVDTSFNYETSDGRYRRVITSTYRKLGGEKEFCHACAPVISEIELRYDPEASTYSLDSFGKYVTSSGSWGDMGRVSLQPIGKDIYCTRLDGAYDANGILSESITLIYQGRVVLQLFPAGDNEGTALAESDVYHFESDVRIDKARQILILHTIGTEPVDTDGLFRVVPVNRIIRYQFTDGVFEKMCD